MGPVKSTTVSTLNLTDHTVIEWDDDSTGRTALTVHSHDAGRTTFGITSGLASVVLHLPAEALADLARAISHADSVASTQLGHDTLQALRLTEVGRELADELDNTLDPDRRAA